jgi:hypothetical protein
MRIATFNLENLDDETGQDPSLATRVAIMRPHWSASPPTSSACKRLGVRIELDEPLELVPGGAEPLQPNEPLAALSSRLSRTAICTGTIHYPRDIKFPSGTSRTGRLVVAKAALTAELPCQLLSYASKKPVFPRDSTSDQWFDHGQLTPTRPSALPRRPRRRRGQATDQGTAGAAKKRTASIPHDHLEPTMTAHARRQAGGDGEANAIYHNKGRLRPSAAPGCYGASCSSGWA